MRKTIEKTLQFYDIHVSIQALFENTNYEVVEKLRFPNDYDDIENAINFFSINTNYVECEKYLTTYKMLKRIAMNRFYEFMSYNLQNLNNYNVEVSSEFDSKPFSIINDNIPDNMSIKFYNFPKNFNTMKRIQIFFEKKSKDDYEVKESIENIKQNFIKQRIILTKPFSDEIINKIIKNPNIDNIDKCMAEIFKFNVCEILFFCHIFQTKINENISILQPLINSNFEALYSSLRPIIINSDKLDYLVSLIDIISFQFNLLFQDFDDNLEVFDITESMINNNLLKITNFNENIVEFKVILTDLIKCGKLLIRPIMMKIICDVQEKLFFRVDQIIKSNFDTLDVELSNFMEYEEKIFIMLKNFKLCHLFLRKLSIILEILNNKLEKEVLNHLSVMALENFIVILNNEIIAKKNVSLSFEIFIIQQIILAIHILDYYNIEAVEGSYDIDFYSITEVFKQ